jgi:hypothetical protein
VNLQAKGFEGFEGPRPVETPISEWMMGKEGIPKAPEPIFGANNR